MELTKREAVFADGTKEQVDVVFYCTGRVLFITGIVRTTADVLANACPENEKIYLSTKTRFIAQIRKTWEQAFLSFVTFLPLFSFKI